MQKLTNEFKIEFTKGDTYALAIKFKNITEDLRLAFFSVKDNPDDAPLIQKSLGAGIDKIDDRDYKNEKTYKFQLQPADTVNLEAQTQYLYDIQVTIGNVVKTVLHGVFVLRNTISGTSSVTASNLEIEVDDEVETEFATTPATNGVEYEQDPVALAKIGDLTLLATTVKDSLVQAINEVKQATGTNTTDINNIKNGTIELPSAKKVSEKIGNKALSEIFESDGTTVKKATNVTNINGKSVNEIFENDGKTVKNATWLKEVEKHDEDITIGNSASKSDYMIFPNTWYEVHFSYKNKRYIWAGYSTSDSRLLIKMAVEATEDSGYDDVYGEIWVTWLLEDLWIELVNDENGNKHFKSAFHAYYNLGKTTETKDFKSLGRDQVTIKRIRRFASQY